MVTLDEIAQAFGMDAAKGGVNLCIGKVTATGANLTVSIPGGSVPVSDFCGAAVNDVVCIAIFDGMAVAIGKKS